MTPGRSAISSSLLFLLPSLGPGAARVARADGFEHPDNGTVALGRAGAFAARASDGSAIQYNVAGFAGQRGTRAMLGLNLTDAEVCFDRAGVYQDRADTAWDGREHPEICDESGFFKGPNPILAVSSDFGSATLPVFAFGVYGPSSNETIEYPRTVTFSDGVRAPAPQRYDLLSRKSVVLYPTIAVAYDVLPWLRVGAAFQAVFASLRFKTGVNLSNGEISSSDLVADLDVLDPFTPAAMLAAQARLGPIDAGITFRYSAALGADGDVAFTRTDFTDPAVLAARSDARVLAAQPESLRLGVRYFHARHTPGVSNDPMRDEVFDVELDAVWEGNSQFESLDIFIEEESLVFDDALGPTFVNDPKVDHSWMDTVSLRLGGDWNVLPGTVAVRAGFSYEPGAAPLRHTRLDFLAYRRVGVHLGATVRLGPWDLSAGGAYLAQSTRTVTDGRTYLLGPAGPAESARPITDGRYESSLLLASLGASYRF